MNIEIWGRRALVLVALGLLIQMIAVFSWSPATFIVSAAVGFPLVLAGAALFGLAVWKRQPR